MEAATRQIEIRTGRCYCGALSFAVSASPGMQGQCHCAPCQHIAGGGPHYFELVAPDRFEWTSGAPASFSHPGVEGAVTRYFCATCGTHILTRRPDQADLVLKVGSLDDRSRFFPRVAICHADAAAFHHVPDGVRVFEGMPRPG